jgi:CRISPR/Cas system-associated exonuclease Cas4 (RecB family)
MLRAITSTSAAVRLEAARQFLAQLPPSTEAAIVGATRGAADDFARNLARRSGATFGLTRFGLTELAARAASSGLAAARHAPATQGGAEAVAARAVFDALTAGELDYFTPVASMPGFPKALARTIHELRLAGIGPGSLGARDAATGDIGRLLARVEAELDRVAVDDRAALFRLAAEAVREGRVRWAQLPIVLLDVPLDSAADAAFVAAIAGRAPEILATVADGDVASESALAALGAEFDRRGDDARESTDLFHLRRHVFSREQPPIRENTGDVRLFSAPGEGREAVEIVRRILDEAARGVPFDEIAVFLRTPQHYLGLIEHACARAGVPAYFDRGVRRPDPAGRAFIALLSCAVEGLSARRFDEYLSLGQVPSVGSQPSAVGSQQSAVGSRQSAVIAPRDEMFGPPVDDVVEPESPEDVAGASEPIRDSDDEAVVAGTLRAPWKWEELVVESAVVGGRTRADGGQRWRRRLDGLAADYRLRIHELKREEPESARIRRFERDLKNLRHLRGFALPIVDDMAAWPDRATWGEWLDRALALAQRALRRPDRVVETLASLRPMSAVGPVGIEEVRDVLRDRLVMLDWEPPSRRYGRIFVGTPHQARGRSFKVVFVPGLAERVVPQRPHEDPLLLDERRAALHGLADQDARKNAERLLLKLSIGAAVDRVYLSYPRLDVAETRVRVPSFYALDVMRAITGAIPDHRQLARDAAEEAGASLAWPAPRDPARAIDDLEHDLASLKPLLESRDPASVRGHARYLLDLNEALGRSVRSRWSRAQKNWSKADGIVRVAPGIKSALDKERLGNRPYSLSALQRFSSCPYQFLLATIYRLEPREDPEPLMRLDPLTRGSLFHRAQAEFYRAMQKKDALPVTAEGVGAASRVVEAALEKVAAEYAEQLAPAIERVWRDEINELRRDLGIWVQKMAQEGAAAWVPAYFEFSFGLSDEGRDERSLKEPVTIDGRFVLRGSVDLIERSPDGSVLRVTDHKTGKNRVKEGLIVGGGATLQPVLYSAAVEQGLGRKVVEGRLYYCTTAGGFTHHPIAMSDYNRSQGLQALTIIDRSIEQGFLVAAPAERACTWCDFRPICGPGEEERVSRKAADRIADLEALRSMR